MLRLLPSATDGRRTPEESGHAPWRQVERYVSDRSSSLIPTGRTHVQAAMDFSVKGSDAPASSQPEPSSAKLATWLEIVDGKAGHVVRRGLAGTQLLIGRAPDVPIRLE